MAKKRVVVLYGGRADEHSISCISTAGVLGAMDTERFEPIPVGITKDGKWIINGEDPRGWNLDGGEDRKSTRLNSSHASKSRMPSSA